LPHRLQVPRHVRRDLLPDRVQAGVPDSDDDGGEFKSLGARERDLILERIVARGGNLRLVAKDLRISRTTLWRRMKVHQIDVRDAVRPSD